MKRRLPSLRFPLRAKFMVLFVILITIPFLISGIVNYIKVSNTIERTIHSYVPQIMDQSMSNFDHYLKGLDHLLIMPNYDHDVMAILTQHRDPLKASLAINSDDDRKMNLFISSLTFNRPDIKGYTIISNDGAVYSNLEQSVSGYWKPSGELWVHQILDADGDLVLIPPHQPGYYIHDEEPVFSLARLIREPYTNEPLGIIKIDLTRRLIEDIFSSIHLSRNGKLYISDSLGNLFYPNELDDSFVPIPDKDIVLVDGEAYVSILRQSSALDLHVIGLIPDIEFQRDANEATRFLVIISLTALVLAYILAIFASKQLVMPIRHLQSTMRKVSKGMFQARASVKSYDEIGELSNGFNIMVEELNLLIKEVYETKYRAREAEISALQSQMNPHFLYNTLEQINMMAIQHNRFEISDIVSDLGRLLRYTVDKHERLVYLREEIRFVEAYLHIQKLRYDERLLAQINIDSSLKQLLVPKLILQPLIENAILHGVGDGAGMIILSAELADNDLVISVEDNGKGMSNNEIAELEKKIYAQSTYGESREMFGSVAGGYALRSIHHRLKLIYGDHYGVSIEKHRAKGSRFLLLIPAQHSE